MGRRKQPDTTRTIADIKGTFDSFLDLAVLLTKFGTDMYAKHGTAELQLVIDVDNAKDAKSVH